VNKTKIEWTDYTWNPVTGCKTGCEYCYARAISHRFGSSFEPTFYPNRLQQPLLRLKPSKIFPVSMGDIMGPWVPDDWIEEVLKVVRAAKWHTFQFLTKWPDRYIDFDFPPNAWLGATCTTESRLPQTINALEPLDLNVRYISAEPLMSGCGGTLPEWLDWLLIGAMTGPRAQRPPTVWVEDWVGSARRNNIRLFIKNNVGWHSTIQDWPPASPSAVVRKKVRR